MAPPIWIVPDSGTPPRIRILSIHSRLPAAPGPARVSRPAAAALDRAGCFYARAGPRSSRRARIAARRCRRAVRRSGSGGRDRRRGRAPAPCGGADCRAAPAASRSSRAARSDALGSGSVRENRSSPESEGRQAGCQPRLSIGMPATPDAARALLLDAQADLGGEDDRDGLLRGIFGGLVADGCAATPRPRRDSNRPRAGRRRAPPRRPSSTASAAISVVGSIVEPRHAIPVSPAKFQPEAPPREAPAPLLPGCTTIARGHGECSAEFVSHRTPKRMPLRNSTSEAAVVTG